MVQQAGVADQRFPSVCRPDRRHAGRFDRKLGHDARDEDRLATESAFLQVSFGGPGYRYDSGGTVVSERPRTGNRLPGDNAPRHNIGDVKQQRRQQRGVHRTPVMHMHEAAAAHGERRHNAIAGNDPHVEIRHVGAALRQAALRADHESLRNIPPAELPYQQLGLPLPAEITPRQVCVAERF